MRLTRTTACEVRDRFSERACLWEDNEKRFWIPRHTFSVAVTFFGQRRAQLKLSESQADAGYEVLGRRSIVQATDLIDFLDEIESEYGDAMLPESMQGHVISVLRRLGGDLTVGERTNRIPLLTADGRLSTSSRLFEDDDAYHRPNIRPDAVHVVHSQISPDLSAQLGVPSLAKAIDERMAVAPQLSSDEQLSQKCNHVERTLHSSEFAAGLRRILRDRESGTMPDISWLRRIEILPTLSFEIELWLVHEGEERVIGSMEGSFFFEPNRERVYVATDSSDLVSDYLVRAIDRRLGGILGDQSATLLRIVDADPARIDSMLTRLRIPQLREKVPARMEEELAANDAATMTFADTSVEVDLVDEDWVSSDDRANAEPDERQSSAGTGGEVEAEASEADIASERQDEWDEETGIDEVSAVDDQQDSTSCVTVVPAEPTGAHSANGASPQAGSRSGAIRDPAAATTGAGRRPQNDRVPDPERTQPGSGAAGVRSLEPSSRKRQRVVTYVVPNSEKRDPHDPTDDELSANHDIGESAEAFVAEQEAKELGRRVQRMPSNNPGYDIISEDEHGQDRRVIEVKGMAGEWTEIGVPLSVRQFEVAWRERAVFWLYVVEYALDPTHRRITKIQDPVGHLTQYRFDHGWRVLGMEVAELPPEHEPDVGRKVRLGEGRMGVVELKRAGQIIRMTLEMPDGTRETAVFKPDMMSVEV